MATDDTTWNTADSGSRAPDINAARAQFEAARLRQQGLVATGRLSRSSVGHKLPRKSLPGYKLLRELQRGGQGVVYLALQESTGRQVAVKILHCWSSAGSATTALTRFEREVDALSRLKHPNIVTIHDCGRDREDVFLVMDHIDGRPLDRYVEGSQQPLRRTLDLFARVCDGVNAAHLRGVIHRDLKPGNILVDQDGEPRLLDFGLAKLVDRGEPDASEPAAVMTQTGQFVGSLPWASPEQAESRADELDVRSDVYSLGVLFFQALTGRFPYPVGGRLDDSVRHIVSTEPTRPSSLRSDIDRELETILLKCLAKEPDRRYQNAGEIARDLRHYLADEPIQARRDSLAYVMSKRIARYRAAVLGAAAMLLVVGVALVVSLSSWRQAEHQRIAAEKNADAARQAAVRADFESQQAQALNAFMREILTSPDPGEQGADVRLTQVLKRASASANERFKDRPAQEAAVRDLIGRTYHTLSMWNESVPEMDRARRLWIDVGGTDDPRALQAQLDCIGMALNNRQLEYVESLLDDLIPRLKRIYGENDPHTLDGLREIAVLHMSRGKVDEAEEILRKLREHPAIVKDDGRQIRIVSALIGVNIYRMTIAPDSPATHPLMAETEALGREWVERSIRHVGPQSIVTLQAKGKLANLLAWQNKTDEAAAICRELLSNSEQLLGKCHFVRTTALLTLGEIQSARGEAGAAADLMLERVSCGRAGAGDDLAYIATLSDSLRYLDRGGRAKQGIEIARDLAAELSKFGGGHGDVLAGAQLYIARFASQLGNFAESDPLFATLLQQERTWGDPNTRARLYLFWGDHLRRTGKFTEAEVALSKAATIMGDVRNGTWESHPDDILLATIALYEDWQRPDKVLEYSQMLNSPADPAR